MLLITIIRGLSRYLQLAVSRLHWLVEAGKANKAHAATLSEVQESGSSDMWGVVNVATLAQPVVSRPVALPWVRTWLATL